MGRFGTCPYVMFIKTRYLIGYEIMGGQVWNLPLRYVQKNQIPDRV